MVLYSHLSKIHKFWSNSISKWYTTVEETALKVQAKMDFKKKPAQLISSEEGRERERKAGKIPTSI